MRSKLIRIVVCSVVCSVCLLLATSAAAQGLTTGVRVGASVDPDQFYFGGHVETEPVVDRLTFRPNVEIGVGNDITVIALNFEFAYKFRSNRPWGVYALGGPALNIVDARNNTDAHGGFNLGLGLEHRDGLFGEFKIGAIDSPDFKIGIGYRFR
jgi:hypothetical protein